VVDDHPLMVEGIRNALLTLPARVTTSCTLIEARAQLNVATFDLVVLDISFRNSVSNGFDLLAQILEATPELGVIMVSMFDGVELQRAAIRAGAKGFVSKMAGRGKLLDAARAVLAGGTWFEDVTKDPARAPTERQRAVLDHLKAGDSQKQIGKAMNLSVRMVQDHLRHARQRAKSRSLHDLLASYLARGWQLLPKVIRSRSAKGRAHPTD